MALAENERSLSLTGSPERAVWQIRCHLNNQERYFCGNQTYGSKGVPDLSWSGRTCAAECTLSPEGDGITSRGHTGRFTRYWEWKFETLLERDGLEPTVLRAEVRKTVSR